MARWSCHSVGPHSLQPLQGRSQRGLAVTQITSPQNLPRLLWTREIPTRTVSYGSFSQSITHTSICLLVLRKKKQNKSQSEEITREKGERKSGGLFSVQDVRVGP